MATLDAITVLTSLDGRPVNKRFWRSADGKVEKDKTQHAWRFAARTVPIPDLETLAGWLRGVGSRPDMCISLGLFRGAPEGEFDVIPQAALASGLGVEAHERATLAGFHEINGRPTAARIKESMEPGNWVCLTGTWSRACRRRSLS
jgi:hypothetical protein